MGGFGAKAYGKLGLQTDVINADPHRMVQLLFDGALLSIQRAKIHLAEKRIAERGQAIGHAIEIVDAGLRVSVDPSVDPAFAGRLISLYQYVTMRLLQANLRNDVKALDEAATILGGLRNAWVQIGPNARAQQGGQAPSAGAARDTAAPPARRVLDAYQA